jgi:hypothetical protein
MDQEFPVGGFSSKEFLINHKDKKRIGGIYATNKRLIVTKPVSKFAAMAPMLIGGIAGEIVAQKRAGQSTKAPKH